jgi:DNA-binding CsgD family transcriptional regulator
MLRAMELPLTGRIDELSQIASLWREPRAVGVIVSGSAGVGKSRLVREALATAEAEGALVHRVQATRSAATVPLAALASLLVENSENSVQLMRRTAETLTEQARGRRVVVGVDDAHSLDPASAALILHLANSRVAFVVATVRSGEPAPDAIVSLWKDLGARRIHLGALADEDIRTLLEAAVGGPVEQVAHHHFHTASAGNVLLLEELVTAAVEDGTLSSRDGLWAMTRPPKPPGSLATVVTERMAALADRERRVMELLALGEPLDLADAIALTGADALDDAESRGLIVVDPDARLAHPLYGEAIRATLPSLRGRRLRLQLAQQLQARPARTSVDALRIARWLDDAGHTAPTDLLIDAAHAAITFSDPVLGERFARRALTGGGGLRAALVVTRALVAQRAFEAAEVVLAAAEDQIDDPDLALDYVQQRIFVLGYGVRVAADELTAFLARAKQWWPDDPTWQRQLDPSRVRIASLHHDLDRAVAASEAGLTDPTLTPTARHELEVLQMSVLLFAGRTADAYALAQRLRPTLPLKSLNDEYALVGWNSVVSQTGFGVHQAGSESAELFAQAIRLGDHAAAGHLSMTQAGVALREARFEDALRWLDEMQAHLDRSDASNLRLFMLVLRLRALAATGDGTQAERTLEQVQARAAIDGAMAAGHRPYVLRAEGWAAVATGDRLRAQQLLIAGAVEVAALPLHVAFLLHDALLAGASARRLSPSLQTARQRTDSPLVAALAGHASSLADKNGPALGEAVDGFERVGQLDYARRAAVDAARAYLDAGRLDSARRALERAKAFHARAQGVPAPVVEGLNADVVELTARESQLIDLVANGLTNQEIADRLVLSIRTVESHVYRAMQKLGISDRRQLQTPP